MEFTVGIWDNGANYYEISVSINDIKKFFPKEGKDTFVYVKIPNGTEFYKVKLNSTFWTTCNHFGKKEILKWLRDDKHIPCEGMSPKFRIIKHTHSENHFEILGLVGE